MAVGVQSSGRGVRASEHQRVREKYAPPRRRDVMVLVVAVGLLGILSLAREVDWFVFAGVLGTAAVWELTKFRLRRNASHFADSSR